jgi:monoamine oxidase
MRLTRREFAVASVSVAVAASLPRTAYTSAAADPDVIVIGAGLSGLEAALTLEENGLTVRLLEGRPDRVGGRVYTLFDVPGHPEVGGNTIAGAYGRMIAAGEKYGVEVVNLAPRLLQRGGQELFIGGERIALPDWPAHPKNPFTGERKKLAPWAWGDAMFKAHMPFTALEEWADPKHARHDVSVHEFLTQHGASEAQIALGFNTNIAYGTTARDVSLLQQAFADYWQQVNRGTLAAFSRTGASLGAPPAAGGAPAGGAPAGGAPPPLPLIGAYRGGNQNLTDAMANRLKGDRLMGRRVVAIEAGDRAAAVRCSDGSVHRAKAVVCSMPFSTLRHVAIDPLPPPEQLAAIETLGYIPITQFHVVPRKAFWKEDGLAPSMWTDGLAGVVLAQRFGSSDEEVTSLTVWVRGLNAEYVDRLGVEEGKRTILSELERMRPAAKGQLEIAAVHSWALDPFAAGDWAIYRPGQVSRFARTMAAPHRRLFFCGEHTALASRGMEGAMESAERVSLEVLSALG